jgi:S-adenosylmethionine:tRNA ribosyltransferase-isomerase
MLRRDFTFTLPEELIAQYPLPERRASRLLTLAVTDGHVEDRRFADFPGLVSPGDLLVFNDTRVLTARLFGHKPSGGKVEILVERILDKDTFLGQIRCSKPLREGGSVILSEDPAVVVDVLRRQGEFWLLAAGEGRTVQHLLDEFGHMPLPPYINRSDERLDQSRYQTVYACNDGAVAAPTAGLHFDLDMLEQLQQNGIDIGYVTLHVGAGTFQPVRVDDIAEHRMHRERVEVTAALCDQVHRARTRGNRVIAVGTTVVRSLEAASETGELRPFCGETDIFITPGHRFHSVDALLTNFHFPESTLLMLVCAFAGQRQTLQAYRHAVDQRYRFFSYGDAMFIY